MALRLCMVYYERWWDKGGTSFFDQLTEFLPVSFFLISSHCRWFSITAWGDRIVGELIKPLSFKKAIWSMFSCKIWKKHLKHGLDSLSHQIQLDVQILICLLPYEISSWGMGSKPQVLSPWHVGLSTMTIGWCYSDSWLQGYPLYTVRHVCDTTFALKWPVLASFQRAFAV